MKANASQAFVSHVIQLPSALITVDFVVDNPKISWRTFGWRVNDSSHFNSLELDGSGNAFL